MRNTSPARMTDPPRSELSPNCRVADAPDRLDAVNTPLVGDVMSSPMPMKIEFVSVGPTSLPCAVNADDAADVRSPGTRDDLDGIEI